MRVVCWVPPPAPTPGVPGGHRPANLLLTGRLSVVMTVPTHSPAGLPQRAPGGRARFRAASACGSSPGGRRVPAPAARSPAVRGPAQRAGRSCCRSPLRPEQRVEQGVVIVEGRCRAGGDVLGQLPAFVGLLGRLRRPEVGEAAELVVVSGGAGPCPVAVIEEQPGPLRAAAPSSRHSHRRSGWTRRCAHTRRGSSARPGGPCHRVLSLTPGRASGTTRR